MRGLYGFKEQLLSTLCWWLLWCPNTTPSTRGRLNYVKYKRLVKYWWDIQIVLSLQELRLKMLLIKDLRIQIVTIFYLPWITLWVILLQMGMFKRDFSWWLDWWHILQHWYACHQRIGTLQLSSLMFKQKNCHDTPKDVACKQWQLQGTPMVHNMEAKRRAWGLSAS